MGKRPNFGFEKRQKDLKKQQKREEKAEKKRLKREAGPEQGDEAQAGDASALRPDADAETA